MHNQPKATCIFFILSGLLLCGCRHAKCAVVNDCEHKRTEGNTSRIYLTGNDLSAWRSGTGDWRVVGDAFVSGDDAEVLVTKSGSGVIVNGSTGKTKDLFSKQNFGDIRAHIEFVIPDSSNSGIYFMDRYELQIFDSYGKVGEYPGIECGGIYPHRDEKTQKRCEGHSPRYNASFAPGRWQTFDVIFRAPQFDAKGNKFKNACFEKVIHNGIVVHENVQVSGPTVSVASQYESRTGPLRLQGDHGPVAYRNIWVSAADSNPFFAMDTCTKDNKHGGAKEQVEMLKETGYDGIGYTGVTGITEMLEALDRNGLRMFSVYLDVGLDAAEQKYQPELEKAIRQLKGRDTILWLALKSNRY